MRGGRKRNGNPLLPPQISVQLRRVEMGGIKRNRAKISYTLDQTTRSPVKIGKWSRPSEKERTRVKIIMTRKAINLEGG